MSSLHRKLVALCILGAGLAWTPTAQADPLMATGFTIGSQPVTLTSPNFVLGPTVNAGAFSLNPPAGVIAYCIDIFQTIHFGTLYYDYTATPLAADLGLSATRKAEIAQLFHGFYDASLTSATNSAAFQLALWEVTFEDALNPLNADGASPSKGSTYATGPDGPGAPGSHRVPPRSCAGHVGDARGRSRHARLRDAPEAEGLGLRRPRGPL